MESQNKLKYNPTVIAKLARLVIPILNKLLPDYLFKVVYDKVYLINKWRIKIQYLIYHHIRTYKSQIDKQMGQLTVKLLPYTMGGPKALHNAFKMVETVKKHGIKGDYDECGVCQGGTAAMLALAAKEMNLQQIKYWFFDSYEGLPSPTEEDYRGISSGNYIQPLKKGSCLGTIQQVETLLFNKCKLDRENIKLVKGWFQDTCPMYSKKIEKIDILRLDGDWYESTKVPLNNFYDQLAVGGVVIVDDYLTCFGSRKAVDEYISEKGLILNLNPDGRGGVWFIKP